MEAKESAMRVKQKLDSLLKNHNSLNKKEISKHSELLLQETNAAMEEIKEEMTNIVSLLENHKKQLSSKQRFLKRHYKRQCR